MRTLLLASLLALSAPLTGCDSVGIDPAEPCLSCAADGGSGSDGDAGGDPGDGGSDDDGGNGSGDDGDNSGDGDREDRFVEVDPGATYLRVSSDDAEGSVRPARAVLLSDLGLGAGKPACFAARGDFFYYPLDGLRASSRGGALVTAVFSRTDELGPRDDQNRVVGAVDAGDDVVTADTFLGGHATDVDEDFAVANVCLTVPEGARYVFFSATDDVFNDNADVREDDRPFGVVVKQ